MRSYLIDEISPHDMRKIREFLKENALCSSLPEIFWVKIPKDLLTKVQFRHRNCGPHVFAVETGPDWIKLEFFVRSLKTMRCNCSGYCTESQREYVHRFAYSMIQHLDIRT